MDSDQLLEEFQSDLALSRTCVVVFSTSGSSRIIYDVENGVPTVFIVKPESQKRFWTRSAALQDGDDVALDLFQMAQFTAPGPGRARH